jgi:hypothetical protein
MRHTEEFAAMILVTQDVAEEEPANYDHDNGEPSTVITLAHVDDIEPIVLSLDDSRRLAAQLLVALFTNDDEFAKKVLEAHFPHDKDGHYHWPRDGGTGI